jgi:hypothetical protein
MPYRPKTWSEKLHNGHSAKVERLDEKFADIPAGATMLVATPEIVDHYIKQIPAGHEGSLQQMRKDLAGEYHADYCCPLTAGIFLRIVAEAAYEDYTAGEPAQKITPFWRVINSKSPVCKKLSFGTDFIQQQRAKEGLTF